VAAGCREIPTTVKVGDGPSFAFCGSGRLASFRIYSPQAGHKIATPFDPVAGRSISKDLIQFNSGDTNFYAYVWNNPSNWADPSGLKPGDKNPNLRCAGYHAIRDINQTSRHGSRAWPNGREYGGWMYRNADGWRGFYL